MREFSNALLRSQGRVASEAGLLRKYTALVIRDLREWLNSSILFRDEPLGDWQNDTIARETIRCCENIVAERGLVGDHWPYGTEQLIERDSGNWPAGIMEWEAHKDPDNVDPNRDERLSEFALRSILSSQFRVDPRDVTNKQIWEAASDFCQHYGPVLMVPNGVGRPPTEAPKPIASAGFWSEREEEFRKYGTGEKSSVEALWSFPGLWQFLDGLHGDDGVAITRCTQVFKSLAREAWKGFSGHQSGESWIDWLDAMRRADYGERTAYPPVVQTEKAIQTSSVLRELIPDEWMFRFVPKSKDLIIADDSVLRPTAVMDRVDIQRAKDSVLITIENIFNASADFCLELRSRTEETHGPAANAPRSVQRPSHVEPIQTSPPNTASADDAGARQPTTGKSSHSGTEIDPAPGAEQAESRHPGALPTKTWAKVQAINANCIAKLRSGTPRHRAICVAVQECYDVLIEDHKEEDGSLQESILIALPGQLLNLAVDVGWLDASILDESRPESLDSGGSPRRYLVEPVYRNWISELLESRAEYWRARMNAAPFGIDLPKPEFVILSLPATTPEGLLLQAHESLTARGKPRKFHEPTLRKILMEAGLAPAEITVDRILRTAAEIVGDPKIPIELVPESRPPRDGSSDGSPGVKGTVGSANDQCEAQKHPNATNIEFGENTENQPARTAKNDDGREGHSAAEVEAARQSELKRQKRDADWTATYSRFSGRNPPEAGRQEELLRDARQYTAAGLDQAVADLRLLSQDSEADAAAACDKIRNLLVRRAWDEFVPRHKNYPDFRLTFGEFDAALWTEGFPSLDDRTCAAVLERGTFTGVEEDSIPSLASDTIEAGNSSATRGEDAADFKSPIPTLDTVRILKWMDDEGWTNETLAQRLHTSERAISSLRNNSSYHGMGVITKLANLMGCDPGELYLA